MDDTLSRRRFWGWGRDSDDPFAGGRDGLKAMLAARLSVATFAELVPPTIADIELPAPRFSPPSSLAAILSQDPWERAAHTYGKAYRDVVRALQRDYRAAPDAVALPRDEAELIQVLGFCEERDLAAIPYGGG